MMLDFKNFKINPYKNIDNQLDEIEVICNKRRCIINKEVINNIKFEDLLLCNQDVLYRLKYEKKKKLKSSK